jgi:hypothetical protein
MHKGGFARKGKAKANEQRASDQAQQKLVNDEIESAKTILSKEVDAENARLEQERQKVLNGEILGTQKRKRLAAFGRAGTIGAGGINAIGSMNSARKTLIGS